MTTPRLSSAQFDALAELLRLRPESDGRQLSELILVNGISVGEAADKMGVKYQRAFDALKRAERGINLAKAICDI